MRLRDLLSRSAKQRLKAGLRRLRGLLPWAGREEVEALYRLLHRMVHDRDQALDLAALQTKDAFAREWDEFREGLYLASDPWFKANVARIISEEELQIRPEWFKGKDVLDAGCGNGRWAIGLAELGANVSVVDINENAVEETRKVLAPYPVRTEFYVAPLEDLSRVLPGRRYDLVWCWGVLHHCRSFTRSFREVSQAVKDMGLLYLYLYGRETRPLEDDLELFKERVRFQVMFGEDRYRFLLKKAGGDVRRLHNLHDLYAPLINRRFEFAEIRTLLEGEGFGDVIRTILHTDLFIRAIKGSSEPLQAWVLPPRQPPFWFERHERLVTR